MAASPTRALDGRQVLDSAATPAGTLAAMPPGDGSRTPVGDSPPPAPPSGSGGRTAVLAVALIFVVGFGAMTISIFARLNIERWTIGALLVIGLLASAVLVTVLIALALISAIRNPPED